MNYQGRLLTNGAPASGTYDVRFSVYDATAGGNAVVSPITNSAVVVSSNGLFTLPIDFGKAAFDGSPRWLEVGVRPTGSATGFTPLAPRQMLAPVPYSLYATSSGTALAVPATNLTGTIADSLLSTNVALLSSGPHFDGVVSAAGFAGNGAGLSNLVAATPGIYSNSSVNLFQTKHLWSTLFYRTNAVKVACFGDSVAWHYLTAMQPCFCQAWGTNGTAFGVNAWLNAAASFGFSDSAGVIRSANTAGDLTNWFGMYCDIPAGESRTFYDYYTSSFDADTVEVYYLLRRGGGTFALQMSTNGGPFGTVLTVATDNGGAVAGAWTNVSLPLAAYRFRVTGASGTTRLLDAGVWNSKSVGLRASWLFNGGINIQQINSVSNIAAAILPHLGVQLVFWSMKDCQGDLSTNTFAAQWPAFQGLLSNCFPGADIVLISTTPQRDNDDLLVWQDSFVRDQALATGWAYFDARNPLISYSTVTNFGFATDETAVHLNNAGAAYIANLIERDLGLPH